MLQEYGTSYDAVDEHEQGGESKPLYAENSEYEAEHHNGSMPHIMRVMAYAYEH